MIRRYTVSVTGSNVQQTKNKLVNRYTVFEIRESAMRILHGLYRDPEHGRFVTQKGCFRLKYHDSCGVQNTDKRSALLLKISYHSNLEVLHTNISRSSGTSSRCSSSNILSMLNLLKENLKIPHSSHVCNS